MAHRPCPIASRPDSTQEDLDGRATLAHPPRVKTIEAAPALVLLAGEASLAGHPSPGRYLGHPRGCGTDPRRLQYWFTNTSAAAGRYHYEEAHAGTEPAVNAAPTGVMVFADDFKTIRVFAERDNSNIVHWSEFDKGGHFAALELPEVATDDIRRFFAGVRNT